MAEVALVLPFSLDPFTGSIVTTTSQETIWSSRVKMAIETNLGERVMRPGYGTRVPSSLFNTVDGFKDVVERDVRRVFVDFLPLLSVIDITTVYNNTENVLQIQVTYSLPNKTQVTTQAGVMVISDINPPYQELTQ
jgi:phage baseplate assembly protein W